MEPVFYSIKSQISGIKNDHRNFRMSFYSNVSRLHRRGSKICMIFEYL